MAGSAGDQGDGPGETALGSSGDSSPDHVRRDARDQGPKPRENTPGNSGTSSLDSVTSYTGDQAPDPTTTEDATWPQDQLVPSQH